MKTFFPRLLLLASALAGACAQAQVGIDQNKALAGNVTAGDTPGFPVTIDISGSYKLTGNLVVPAGVNGIEINAPNVTLDLNGFSITGPITCTGAGASLACTGTNFAGVMIKSVGVTVRNGAVTGFGLGVWAAGAAPRVSRVEQMRVYGNGSGGIQLNDGSAAFDNLVYRNGGFGIAAQRSTLQGNVVHDNKGNGLWASEGSIVLDNTSSANGGYGLYGQSSDIGYGRNAFANNAIGFVYNTPVKLAPNSCNFSAC